MTVEERMRLEAALRSTAAAIEVPPTPALAPGVRSRLAAPQPSRRRLMPALAFAAACLIALLGVLVFSPAAREAVADFLGVDGIRIGFGEPSETPLDFDIDVGRPVTPTEAQVLVDFPVRTFHPDELGPADAYYYSERIPGGAVSVVYEPAEELPEVGDSGVGLLLTQFRGQPDETYFKKLFQAKEPVEFVTVEGEPGYWVGNVHELLFYDRDGAPGVEDARLSAPALVWQHDGVTYRLESNLTKEEAIALANTLS